MQRTSYDPTRTPSPSVLPTSRAPVCGTTFDTAALCTQGKLGRRFVRIPEGRKEGAVSSPSLRLKPSNCNEFAETFTTPGVGENLALLKTGSFRISCRMVTGMTPKNQPRESASEDIALTTEFVGSSASPPRVKSPPPAKVSRDGRPFRKSCRMVLDMNTTKTQPGESASEDIALTTEFVGSSASPPRVKSPPPAKVSRAGRPFRWPFGPADSNAPRNGGRRDV